MKVKRAALLKGFYDMDVFVLNPPRDRSYGDLNNDSVVVKGVTRENNSIIFCADVESAAMEAMLRFGSFLKSDIMKAPHHGQGVGNKNIAKEFFDMVKCEEAVVTNKNTGKLNGDLLAKLRNAGARVYITGLLGAIVAEEKNERFLIQPYHGQD
jgi:beta-lactamase superfamily II metal-dependent hydrolase